MYRDYKFTNGVTILNLNTGLMLRRIFAFAKSYAIV